MLTMTVTEGLRCVRCGDEPRHLDTFLGELCLRDGATAGEWQDAQLRFGDVTSQRDYLVRRWEWAGGWRSRGRS